MASDRDVTVHSLVESYIDEHPEYDGLLQTDGVCACLVSDLAPCGEMSASCRLGHRVELPARDEDCLDCEDGPHWHINAGPRPTPAPATQAAEGDEECGCTKARPIDDPCPFCGEPRHAFAGLIESPTTCGICHKGERHRAHDPAHPAPRPDAAEGHLKTQDGKHSDLFCPCAAEEKMRERDQLRWTEMVGELVTALGINPPGEDAIANWPAVVEEVRALAAKRKCSDCGGRGILFDPFSGQISACRCQTAKPAEGLMRHPFDCDAIHEFEPVPGDPDVCGARTDDGFTCCCTRSAPVHARNEGRE